MKYISILFSLTVLLFIPACTDLDLSPRSSTTPDVLFQDEDAYRQFVARVYAGLAVTGQNGPAGSADISSLDEGFSNYLRQYWQLQEITTDEAVLGWGDEGVPALNFQTWTSANQFVRAMYYRIFFQVSMANEFLRETTDEKLDSRGVSAATREEIRAYRAEARFLRALSYWHGIDLFGDIPFYTEENSIGSDAPDQFARAEVFNFIVDELNAIEGDLLDPGTNEYGRADKAAAWILQAKLYLNAEVYAGQNRYAECIEACSKIINSGAFSLQDNYRHLFTADNHLSPEIIFAIPQDGRNTQTWGGATYLVHAPLGNNMVDNIDDETGEELENEALEVYGVNNGWFGLRTTSALVNLFPDETGGIDSRAIFYTNGQVKDFTSVGELSNFGVGYAVPKYINLTSEGVIGSDVQHPDTDFPMFRFADVHLMYAEAVLRGGSGGDVATAVTYINALRERAYGNASGNITEADLTLDFILDERARELYWEGHRRTDLVRFNQFTENGTWPLKGETVEGSPTESFKNVFPFPASELLANPKLTQKQGY